MADQTPEKPTGDPRLDAILARLAAKAAEEGARKTAEAEIEPQSGPESARSDSPGGKGRVESAENAQEAPGVPAEKRSDPILPVVIERVEEAPEREAGRLAFAGVVEERKSLPAQLPLLPRPEGPSVPILELSDWRGVPTMARGRGAPLDLRLAVGACVLMPHVARAARGRLAVTVRELRDFLFPNGWERRRDWPRIQAALWKAHNYMIPGRFQWRGRAVDGWIPFRMAGGAGDGATLDDLVLIDVELPPWLGPWPGDRPARARAAGSGLRAALPGLHRGSQRGVAAGRHPTAAPPQPPLPSVELGSGELPRVDGSGPGPPRLRIGRHGPEPDAGAQGQALGGPAGGSRSSPGRLPLRTAAGGGWSSPRRRPPRSSHEGDNPGKEDA